MLLFSSCPICSRQTDDCWSYLTALSKPGNYVKRGISQLLHRASAGACSQQPVGCAAAAPSPGPGSAMHIPGSSPTAWTLPWLGHSPHLQSRGQTHTTSLASYPHPHFVGLFPNQVPVGLLFFFFENILSLSQPNPSEIKAYCFHRLGNQVLFKLQTIKIS